jgi:hypothetical protein
MDGVIHAASVSDVGQVAALKCDRVFGHYAVDVDDGNGVFLLTATLLSVWPFGRFSFHPKGYVAFTFSHTL